VPPVTNIRIMGVTTKRTKRIEGHEEDRTARRSAFYLRRVRRLPERSRPPTIQAITSTRTMMMMARPSMATIPCAVR
jgi:hypothetical protein